VSPARAITLGVGLALLIAGCASQPRLHKSTRDRASNARAGGYYEDDGPPTDKHIDLGAIADAVPKKQPRSKYGNPDSYTTFGKTYHVLASAAGFTQTGMASWYGRKFEGQRTSSGAPYDMFKMTAAHKRLPIPCYVQVTNLDNGRRVIVKINDRGPFRKNRIIDLSYVAALKLGMVATGSAPVRIRTVTPKTRLAQDKPNEPSPGRTIPLRSAPASVDAIKLTSTGAGSAPALAQPASPTRTTAQATGSRGHLFLQTGAFGNPDNAKRLRAQLEADGVSRVVIVKPSRATPLYRVQVGPFTDSARRTRARQRLAARGFPVRTVEHYADQSSR
jgi:rare lipoprotein A